MFEKIKIFCGPNNYDFDHFYFEESNEFIVGVDSGLEYLSKLNKQIDLAVGDFDSIDKKKYEMIKEGDKIAVAMSGGKDSLLLAKLFQELKKRVK